MKTFTCFIFRTISYLMFMFAISITSSVFAIDELYSFSNFSDESMQKPDSDSDKDKGNKDKDKDKDNPTISPADTIPPPSDTVTPPPPDTVTPPPDTVPPPTDTVPPPPVVIPTAVISGTDQICPGQETSLNVSLTGTAPWEIVVLRNGNEYLSINNIPAAQYNLIVDEAGVYTISTVTDAESSGPGSGSGTVTLYSPPSASISGGQTICNDSDAEITVSFTGSSPWRFSYILNSGSPQMVQNVTSNPYNFPVNNEGTYALFEVYDQNCKGTVSGSAEVSFSSAPDVSITDIENSYSSKSDEWIELTGSPAGGQFIGKGIIDYNNTWYFLPGLAPVGNNTIVYQYRSSPESCYGYDSITVRIFETSAEIVFEDERNRFCKNDSPFMVTGLSLGGDETDGTFTISGNQGLTDNNDNTAFIDPSKLESSQYTLTFTAGNGESVERTFEIGDSLAADFEWNTQCFQPGQTITFNNTSSSPYGFLSSGSYSWGVHIGNETVHFHNEDIAYSFQDPGTYSIDLLVENSYGCRDTVSKMLVLNPVVQLAGNNYFEDFESLSSWQSGKASNSASNSWELGEPVLQGSEGFDGSFSGTNSWYTNLPGAESPAEESWITSPCFDFSGTNKPTLVSMIWRSFDDNRDGANFQYSIDQGKSWLPVGSVGDGINWFTGYYGPSSSQTTGWTGIKDAQWVETRHALDFLKDQPSVMFRFTYQSSGNALGNDGLAVDDIGIVERNRMILIEHFTNSSDSESADADEELNSLAERFTSNVIDIQYHTSNPPDDPFNEDNPSVPNTRQFYYNVSDVPYAVINGGTQSNQQIDYNTKVLNENQITIESLYDSDFRIDVTSMAEGNTLYVEAEINALIDIPLNELSVRMVVIEPVITGITGENGSTTFRNVVREMIPDAAGLTLYREWHKGETMTLREKLDLDNIINPASLKVVVFIQDESTKEIYQAAMDSRGVVTGSDGTKDGNEFAVFPNPVKGLLTIQFGRITGNDITVELFNATGSLVYTGNYPQGENTVELSTGGYAEGMYILKISTDEGVIGTRKLVFAP